jgi:hypothetical protein
LRGECLRSALECASAELEEAPCSSRP